MDSPRWRLSSRFPFSQGKSQTTTAAPLCFCRGQSSYQNDTVLFAPHSTWLTARVEGVPPIQLKVRTSQIGPADQGADGVSAIRAAEVPPTVGSLAEPTGDGSATEASAAPQSRTGPTRVGRSNPTSSSGAKGRAEPAFPVASMQGGENAITSDTPPRDSSRQTSPGDQTHTAVVETPVPKSGASTLGTIGLLLRAAASAANSSLLEGIASPNAAALE